MLIENRLSHLN
jgi:hypothetical protein